MRSWKVAVRFGLRIITSACVITGGYGTAQEFSPSVRFNVADGAWNVAGNWLVADSNPNENRVPAGDEIAAVNSGTARVSTAVPDVSTLGVRGGGTLSLETGGALTVGEAIIGPGGTLRYAGGTLTADTLTVTGAIDLDSAAAGDITLGKTWSIANSANVLGGTTAVTLDGGDLERGLRLAFGSDATSATVTVTNEPILVIDRFSGEAVIENPIGELDLKGYTITSGIGAIGPADVMGLADQGEAGWAEANITDNRFTEYSLTGAKSLAAGGGVSIGTLLDQFLPPNQEDVAFEYILGDGSVFPGKVEYQGPLNDLVLQVDPDTGAAAISHQAQFVPAVDLIGYTVRSASGSLVDANFSGFTGAGLDGWTISNPQDAALTEVSLEGSQVFSTGSETNLGNIFAIGGTQDLTFEYATVDGNINFGTVSYDVVNGVVCDPNTMGDINGDGSVGFPDFLILSANFGMMVNSHEDGDIDCDGTVAFPDFLVLSANFGQDVGATASAQAVPEPTAGLSAILGLLGGMLMLRRHRKLVAGALVAVAASLAVSPHSAEAQSLDARFVRYHPDSPNEGLNSIIEAQGVLNGSVLDVIINDDLTGSYDVVDLAGDPGTFPVNNAYLNGVNDNTMNNFLTYLSGEISLDEGDYTIGCGSDDGCFINMPGISFIETFNESGPVTAGDGQLLFNPGRGHAWTFGTFAVAAGGITTPFEALSNEGGGGDSFEIGITDFIPNPEFGEDLNDATYLNDTFLATELFLLEDGAVSGLSISAGPFVDPNPRMPGDFNLDGVIDSADAGILQSNMFSAGNADSGDMTADGNVNFADLAAFAPVFAGANGGGAASVPEPASSVLILLGLAGILATARSRR